MIAIENYIQEYTSIFTTLPGVQPWELTQNAVALLEQCIDAIEKGNERNSYRIEAGVAIHKSATIEKGVTLKGPAVIGKRCFIGAHAYIRGGVFLAKGVSIGPGCEVKSSFIGYNSALAHFNFIGDSILGSGINIEAGAVIANHFNEKEHKTISVLVDGKRFSTGITKFGALVGDHCAIGANAVLSPGTLLPPQSVVKRLELVEQ